MSATGNRKPEAGKPSFYCDMMLGRLARWLRLAGYHAGYAPEIEDWDMLRLCAREGLVLLTRDRGVMERWQVRRGLVKAALLESGRLDDQLREVRARFDLRLQEETRCPECNAVLEAAARESVKGEVPGYVFETQESFRRCPSCGRVYWKATHWSDIDRVLGGAFGSG